MDRNRTIIYPVTIVPQHQIQEASITTEPHSQHLILQQQQPHSQQPQQQNSSTSQRKNPPQAEYFDISRNQPSTANVVVTYRSDVRDLANKLDMKRGSVERWLREKYNREHPNDKIVHPRGFKFSDEQRHRLTESFERDRYPKPYDMELLAYELNVKKEQVKNWFHDQRRKFKRLEQLAMNQQTKKVKKSKYTRQQRKKLEEFFEKNFHPYPGDSRRIVNEFESGYPMRYDYGNLPNSKKTIRSRGFKFTEEQRRRLKEQFLKNKYPTPNDMDRLAHMLGVRKVQVKNWFHDQRRKLKREQAAG